MQPSNRCGQSKRSIVNFATSISFDAARRLAKKQAKSLLSNYIGEGEEFVDILEERFIENEECWMFFRNKNLKFPLEATLPASVAYVVSKEGEVRTTADFSDNPAEMKKLLDLLTEYFRAKKKESQ